MPALRLTPRRPARAPAVQARPDSRSRLPLRLGRFAALLLAGLLALTLLAPALAALEPERPEIAYSQDVWWRVDDLPDIAPMQQTVRSVLGTVYVEYPGVDGDRIAGFYPGSNYQYFHLPGWTPFYLYARDTATILPMARYYYPAYALRSFVEELLRLQYPDGAVSATVSPDFKVDKASTTSDEETSAILAAAEAYQAAPDPAWLSKPLRGQPLIDRLNRAMEWLLTKRFDPGFQLVKRAHTTDWGDVKWETTGDPSHMDPSDQWTVSIYDQAIAYDAMRSLARLNTAAGRAPQAQRWDQAAAALRAATDAALWQDDPDRGYYRIHKHVEPDHLPHDFDEGAIVAIGNAAAVYYGLAEPDKVPRIWQALERARLEAGAAKVGLTLEPPYPGWLTNQMDPHNYQNGALWDWWAGRQITAEFTSGYSSLARDHLMGLARDWATHPSIVREWESPWLKRNGVDQKYAGAAGVVGQAVVEGLYGVQFLGQEVRLTPRLGTHPGSIHLFQPASNLYAAYRYEPSATQVSLWYGSNSPTALSVHLPQPWPEDSVVYLDQQSVLSPTLERVGEDTYLVVPVPSGSHRLDVLRATTPPKPQPGLAQQTTN